MWAFMLSDAMLYEKAGVVTDGVSREVWFAVGVFHAIRASFLAGDTTITSMHDGEHMAGSLHYTGRAVDLRLHDLSPEQAASLARLVKSALNVMGFDVVFEQNPEHLHIEFDPKPGRVFLRPEPTTAPAAPAGKA